jgi:hypothetical protein
MKPLDLERFEGATPGPWSAGYSQISQFGAVVLSSEWKGDVYFRGTKDGRYFAISAKQNGKKSWFPDYCMISWVAK